MREMSFGKQPFFCSLNPLAYRYVLRKLLASTIVRRARENKVTTDHYIHKKIQQIPDEINGQH